MPARSPIVPTINAVHSGTGWVVDNADGTTGANEWGSTAATLDAATLDAATAAGAGVP